jgi:hypothetical protein
MKSTMDRIGQRVIEIQMDEVPGVGWVAVGIVRVGLPHEQGLRFDASAASALEAEERLRAEVEAYFA